MEVPNIKKTLEGMPDKKTDRGRQSIYVSNAVWQKFKKLTAKKGTSLVLEEWMEEAIEEAEKASK